MNKHGYVIVKEHYTEEHIHEIQCICLSEVKALQEQYRIQNEIDPNFHEWKIEIYSVDIVE